MNQEKSIEISVICPVCGAFLMGVEGGIRVGDQLRFRCNSRKCRGRNRYISRELIQRIIDKSVGNVMNDGR